MNALCIGLSNIETTCIINSEINIDKINTINEVYERCGGKASNIAYLLGKWGINTYIASSIGSDEAGTKIKKELENVHVNIDYIETNYDKGTSKNVVLVNKTTKTKTVLELDSGTYLKKYTFSSEPNAIIVDGNDYNASLSALNKYPGTISIYAPYKLSKEITEYGKYVKYIILNKRIAEEFVDSNFDFEDGNNLVNIYNMIKQRFNNNEVIITLGERGVLYSLNDEVKILPTVTLEVVDPTGAGDIFVGAFAYSLLKGYDYEKSLIYANIAASLSTSKLTGRDSIPSLMDVANYYEQRFNNNQNNIINISSNGVEEIDNLENT